MAEGFKILDAYVQVTAESTGIGQQIVRDIQAAAPAVQAAVSRATASAAHASEELTAARRRETESAAMLRSAEARLSDLRVSDAVNAAKLTAAEERFTAAQRESAAAMLAAKTAASDLASVQARLATVTADAAVKAERAGRDQFRSTGSGFGTALIGGMKTVVAGAVGGLVTAITLPLIHDVGEAIDAVVTTAKTAIIDYNSTLEQANIGFTTMLGSAEKAKSFLGDLQKFAAATPFEFQDLTRASQRLLAMGVAAKDVIPYMTGIGDAVAGLGGSADLVNQVVLAIGQMTAKGKIQGDDLMQLTEAGIPALKILADTYGVTTAEMDKMISAGKILSDRAVPAIIQGLEKGTKTTSGFGGMMEKQSKTMAGSLSNIRDSVNQTLSGAFLPLFKVVERVTGKIATFAGSKAVQRWAKDTAKSVGDFVKDVEAGFKEVFADPAVQKGAKDLLKDFNKAIKDSGPILKTVIPDLVTFAKELLPDLFVIAGKLVKRIPDIARQISGWAAVLKWAGPIIGGFIGWLVDLAGWFIDIPKKAAEMTVGVTVAITQFARDAQQRLLEFVAWLPGIGAAMVAGIVNGILGQGNPIAGALSSLLSGAAQTVASGIGALKAAADSAAAAKNGAAMMSDKAVSSQLGAAYNQARSAAPKVAGGVVKAVTAPAAAALSGGSGGGAGSSKSLRDIFETFRTIGRQVAKGVHAGLLGSVSDVKSASKSMRDAIHEAFDEGKISKGRESTLLKQVKATTDRLVVLAKRREAVVERLKAAKDRLKELTDDRASFKEGIRSAAVGAGDIGSLYEGVSMITSSAAAGSLDGRSYQASYTTSTQKEGTGLLGFRQKLRQIVKDTRAFRTNLKELIKRGLDKYTIQELLSAGATAGLPITRDLLADNDSFNDIVHLQGELNKAGTALGELGAAYTYDSDIADTSAKVSRLRDSRDSINVTMIVEAQKIDEVSKVVSAVKAAAKTAKAAKTGTTKRRRR